MTARGESEKQEMARDWRQNAVSASEAVSLVQPGDKVFLGSACATPRLLVRALEESNEPLADVELVHFLTDGAVPLYDAGPVTRFRHRTYFVGSDMRALVAGGQADYVPLSARDAALLIRQGRQPIDVAFLQATPPDQDGRVSLGISVDLALAAVAAARNVVVEINPNMPRTNGESSFDLSAIDRFVVVDEPLIEYLHPASEDVAEKIARYIARVIDDGSTLAIGLGRIPNEMLKYLTNRKDLGIHSDVITEPLVDLIESGVVTGARKTLHPGKIVASYAMGTRRLYELMGDNPGFELRPIDYVSDPEVIAKNDHMVAVSQAFAIDLTGQVCADQFEGEFYSGVSTQNDFLRGAAAASGGKAIVCLTSTTDDGKISRIRSLLKEGEGVTVARSDVHFVVTEYGSAYLFGRSIRERALALIEIAHPDFRQELLDEAKRLGYVSPDQTLRSRQAYPQEEESEVSLADGEPLRIRPTRASDVRAFQALFHDLRPEDIYTRFFTNLKSLSENKAQHLCNVDYEDEMAFAAVTGDIENERLVGSCCYFADPSTRLADVAFMIHPDYQGKGLGTILVQRLMDYARRNDLRGFTADVLSENKPMLRVFEKSGAKMDSNLSSGVFEVTLLFQ